MMSEILSSNGEEDSEAIKAIKALTELAKSEPIYKQVIEAITDKLEHRVQQHE